MEPPVKMIKQVMMIGIAFAILGVGMAWTALVLEQTKLTPLQEDYFAGHTKAERDSAAVNSQLAEDQAEIAKLKPTILTIKLVGIATVLFGIVVVLLGILRMLSLMPVGLSDVLRANLEDMGLGNKS